MAESENYKKGTEVRRQLMGAAYADKMNKTVYDDPMMQKFGDYAREAVFGMLWSRPGLDMKTRALICVISDTSQARWPELAIHLRMARNQGWTEDELSEALMHLCGYIGLPSVREALSRLLGLTGTERFRYIYDNEAYVIGDVLIEHGNRYDGFNVVNHDALRELRSLQSRRQGLPEAEKFPAPTGSLLVSRIMNAIKTDYPFVDLLKPETEAAVPMMQAACSTSSAMSRVVRMHQMLAHQTSTIKAARQRGRCGTPAPRVASQPPTVEHMIEEGKCPRVRPRRLSCSSRWAPRSPGSQVMRYCSASTCRARIRFMSTTKPSAAGSAAPVTPEPAPKGTSGTR